MGMATKVYHQGDRITTRSNYSTKWYVLRYGQRVETVDLKAETYFPKRDHPDDIYVCAG